MKRRPGKINISTTRKLKIWWLLLSTVTTRIFILIGMISAALLVALGTVSGTTQSKVIDPDSSNLRMEPELLVEIADLQQPEKYKEVLAQADSTDDAGSTPSLQMNLQNLVNQALNGETIEEAPVPAPETEKTKVSKSAGDILKGIVGRASGDPLTGSRDSYISKLNAEVEVTVVITEKEAQKPAAIVEISEIERRQMIQDIASKIANDSEETIQNVEYETVKPNDSLWLIAERIYGDPYKYKLLYQVNKDLLTDEDSLVVGQKIRIPQLDDN